MVSLIVHMTYVYTVFKPQESAWSELNQRDNCSVDMGYKKAGWNALNTIELCHAKTARKWKVAPDRSEIFISYSAYLEYKVRKLGDLYPLIPCILCVASDLF